MFGKKKGFFICNYHGKFLPVAGRNATNSILSKIRLITHKHDGNVLVGHILPRKTMNNNNNHIEISCDRLRKVCWTCFTLSTNFCTVHYMRKPLTEYTTHTHTEHQIILNACLSNTYILAACKWRKTSRIISVTFKYLLITQMLPASQWTHLTIWLYYTCFWCLDISLQSVSGGNHIAVEGIALPQSYPPTL